jgi:hypothetical protein
LADVTEPIVNTIRRLFDEGSRQRILRQSAVRHYLVKRWTFHEAGSPASPFWTAMSGGRPPLELQQLILFLLADASPPGEEWSVQQRYLSTRLTIDEQRQLLSSVAAASLEWNINDGRFHPGLDEILFIFGGLINEILRDPKFMGSAGEACWSVPIHLIDELRTFPGDWDDVDTVLDFGRAYEIWTYFTLSLPINIGSNGQDIINHLVELAKQARMLFRINNDPIGEDTRTLDLIDGQLLPWSMAADQIDREPSQPMTLTVALDRFTRARGPDARFLPRFPLDFNFELGAPNPDAGVDAGLGFYSMAHAIALGEALARTLSRNKGRHSPPLWPPARIKVSPNWVDDAEGPAASFDKYFPR